jgi:predicted subunit of tRNA(5-methylaminomethyl-2-thiouridylate) methyltransferase
MQIAAFAPIEQLLNARRTDRHIRGNYSVAVIYLAAPNAESLLGDGRNADRVERVDARQWRQLRAQQRFELRYLPPLHLDGHTIAVIHHPAA